MSNLTEKIFSANHSSFESVALEVFKFQYEGVDLYRQFCTSLKKNRASVNSIADIPFLPIEFFKSHIIIHSEKKAERIFASSGTTGQVSSKHYVADLCLYERSFVKGFERAYGNVQDYVILALLPSYLERDNSSLVYMAKDLIEKTTDKGSDFFLHDHERLLEQLHILNKEKCKTILIGVTFALLDFAEKFKINFPELIVMETGGMKGKREEMTREEVHLCLRSAFGVNQIHSEYGMTELLSQAYSKGNGIFEYPPWMKVLTRDLYEPLRLQQDDIAGAVNVIDLANLYSCSFIATGDLGKVNPDGSFEILGRMDNAEIRGCNLMVV